MRLIMASASGNLNKRGFGLPAWGLGVTVPTSTNPKPRAARPSKASAFLSRPAAKPTGFGNSSPITVTGKSFTLGARAGNNPKRAPAARLSKVKSWAVSGDSWNNTLRATEYKDTPL